jgi:hypothetical protein
MHAEYVPLLPIGFTLCCILSECCGRCLNSHTWLDLLPVQWFDCKDNKLTHGCCTLLWTPAGLHEPFRLPSPAQTHRKQQGICRSAAPTGGRTTATMQTYCRLHQCKQDTPLRPRLLLMVQGPQSVQPRRVACRGECCCAEPA